MGQEPLFGARRRRGPVSQQMNVTLTAWRKDGTLGGDEHAAQRSALRVLAECVDGARDAARSGEASWLSVARTVALMEQALLNAAGGVDRDGDPFEDELRTLLRNAPEL